MALLYITDASGREWQYPLSLETLCSIGRAPDNCIMLNDPRASRYHAHIRAVADGFMLVDGIVVGGELRRSANKVFINGEARTEYRLTDGDRIAIGASTLRYEESSKAQPNTPVVTYDDRRLGHTQVLVSAGDVIQSALLQAALRSGPEQTFAAQSRDAQSEELMALRRKADILALLYEMSKTLGSVFDLDAIFSKATDIIFRVTPADRVVALLAEGKDPTANDSSALRPVAMRVRDEKQQAQAKKLTIGRTITRKAMRDRVALLSQDATADAQFAGVESIVSQGVRSTICAPLVAESGVHGALYADRLDPFAVFSRDDLELISAVAAQTAVAVENARTHERLAREEVARANYGRFLPEYVVRQMLENPESFALGGVNQIVTVLFADIRGFTRVSEHTSPEEVVAILNRFFSPMTEIIFAHGGTLDKYIGDGLMALFGAPTATPDDASNAVEAAVAMQRRLLAINEELRLSGFPEIGVGIGLHTGEATVGYIGSERRSEYTAIGDTVNVAARLESNARGGQILISEATARASAGASVAAGPGRFTLEPAAPLAVKNRTEPVPIFQVEWQ